MSEFDVDVVVVGAGPVGLGLAVELGQRGVRVTVLERHAQPQPIPKGQNLTQRTMEHFYAWGCEAELRAARTMTQDSGIGGITAFGSLTSPYHYEWLNRGLVRRFYTRDNERLPQYATEAVLRARADAIAEIDLRTGWDVEEATQDPDSVTVVARGRDGEGRMVVRARYAVGCDGSRSTVREAIGITQTRTDHDRVMVLLVFRSSRLDELLTRYPGASYYNVLDPALEGYWKFFGRVDDKAEFFFHAPVPPSARDGDFDFKALLDESVGESIDIEFAHIGFWDLRFAVADSYRDKRVFLAGDAAHSHPPYGGYGINTGFEDARNLGWKLAAVLKGWGGATLLDSYDAERRLVFKSTASDFIARAIEVDKAFLASFNPVHDREAFERAWMERAQGAKDDVFAFEPNYIGSPVVTGGRGTPSACGKHSVRAIAGKHLAPVALSSGEQVDEVLGDGLTLFAFDADPRDVDAFERSAEASAVSLTVVHEDRLANRAELQARLVLVRADQFISWCGDATAGEAEAILERAIGR